MTLHRPMFPPMADALLRPLQIDRRGLLCGLATMPAAVAMPAPAALAASPASTTAISDPILEAIEAHVLAVAKFENSFDDVDDDLSHEASAEADQTAWAMLHVDPTSIEGVWALLLYFAQSAETNEQFFPEVMLGEVNFPAALAGHAAKALSRIILEGAR